jgi:hypothetical protein
MPSSPSDVLDAWLGARLDDGAANWLHEKIAGTLRGGADAPFLLAFSAAPRHVGRAALALSEAELAQADNARPGFQPAFWGVGQAARTLLVLALPADDRAAYRGVLDRLFADGDHGELVTLYQALPLLPHPPDHRARAAEGIRSNMQTVFEAVALRNPYPAEMLDETAWNQLVLKCLFVGSALIHVHGIDGRGNPTLAQMLSDYAHERWAAGRSVSPELWRPVGPLADGALLADLERVLATGTDVERAGVALAARHNPNAEALFVAHGPAVDRALAAYPTWKAVVAAIPHPDGT